jgi:hypothetical protein
MYAVFMSGKWWSSLSNAIKNNLVRLERIQFAEEAISTTSNYVEKILFNDIKKINHWIHWMKPCNSKAKQSKFY